MIIFGTDFDGTLYFHDREEHVQKVDVEGIKNFQKTGNLFGLVTGRGDRKSTRLNSSHLA